METRNRIYRIEGAAPGVHNMAMDVAALEAAESGVCTARVYLWDGPWVSLGMSQTPEEALNLPACERLGVRWVVRPTGGRAVLHGNDVTFSLAAPLREVGAEARNVRAVYRALAPIIVEALGRAGAKAILGERSPAVQSASYRGVDCFRSLSANDVADQNTGTKLAGTALRIRGESVLLQASIPTGPCLVSPETIYQEAAPSNKHEHLYPDRDLLMASLAEVLEARGYLRAEAT